MKRIGMVGFLTVMISIFVITLPAFSDTCGTGGDPNDCGVENYNWGDITLINPGEPHCPQQNTNGCEGCPDSCTKCAPYPVPCAKTTTEEGYQGQQIVTTQDSYPFDFDGTINTDPNSATYGVKTSGAYGYCLGADVRYNSGDDPLEGIRAGYNNPYGRAEEAGDSRRNCRFIADLCMCPEACELTVGTRIGIQMIIRTPGVYFADYRARENWTINFEIADSDEVLCDRDYMKPGRELLDSSGDRVGTVNESIHDRLQDAPLRIRNFGPVTYYRTCNDTPCSDTMNYFETAPIAQYPTEEPLSGRNLDPVPDRNRVQVLQSNLATDYVINEDDIKLSACYVWLDIPPMRVDSTVATPGAEIKITVRFLFHKEDYICDDCSPPGVCECTKSVGKVCCEADDIVDPTQGCVFFPYVFQGMNAAMPIWQSGIAVSAIFAKDVAAADYVLPDGAYCELTLMDQRGNVATWKKTDMGSGLVWAFTLDQILSNFTMVRGASLEPGASALFIRSNYRMDGYSFMLGDFDDVAIGAGQLARSCDDLGSAKCCP